MLCGPHVMWVAGCAGACHRDSALKGGEQLAKLEGVHAMTGFVLCEHLLEASQGQQWCTLTRCVAGFVYYLK